MAVNLAVSPEDPRRGSPALLPHVSFPVCIYVYGQRTREYRRLKAPPRKTPETRGLEPSLRSTRTDPPRVLLGFPACARVGNTQVEYRSDARAVERKEEEWRLLGRASERAFSLFGDMNMNDTALALRVPSGRSVGHTSNITVSRRRRRNTYMVSGDNVP